MVYVTGQFVVGSVSSPTGTLAITGLPYTSGNVNGANAAVTIFATDFTTPYPTYVLGDILQNNSQILVYLFTSGSVSNIAGSCQAGTYFFISASYPVN
jgi:hypothetical protein